MLLEYSVCVSKKQCQAGETCKSGVWRSSLVSNKCCHEREAYSINTTISTSMSEDGCAKASIDCVEETPGNAKTVIIVENYCEDYATKNQLEEIKEILVEKIEAGSGCHGEKMEAKVNTEGKQFGFNKLLIIIPLFVEPKVLLFGPSTAYHYYGKSEVLV